MVHYVRLYEELTPSNVAMFTLFYAVKVPNRQNVSKWARAHPKIIVTSPALPRGKIRTGETQMPAARLLPANDDPRRFVAENIVAPT